MIIAIPTLYEALLSFRYQNSVKKEGDGGLHTKMECLGFLTFPGLSRNSLQDLMKIIMNKPFCISGHERLCSYFLVRCIYCKNVNGHTCKMAGLIVDAALSILTLSLK